MGSRQRALLRDLPAVDRLAAEVGSVSVARAVIEERRAELLAGASDGLGRWMLDAGATGNRPDLVYAATLIAGLIGLVINAVLVVIERRFLSWQPALRQTGKGN